MTLMTTKAMIKTRMALLGSDCAGARACDAPTDDSDGNFAIDAIDL